jgi:hypothetical protein
LSSEEFGCHYFAPPAQSSGQRFLSCEIYEILRFRGHGGTGALHGSNGSKSSRPETSGRICMTGSTGFLFCFAGSASTVTILRRSTGAPGPAVSRPPRSMPDRAEGKKSRHDRRWRHQQDLREDILCGWFRAFGSFCLLGIVAFFHLLTGAASIGSNWG